MRLKLIDFGSARDMSPDGGGGIFQLGKFFSKISEEETKVAVSPIFSAPEVFVEHGNEFSFDIFSVGILFSVYIFNFVIDEKKMR